ncbi:MAG: hypothetical protein JXA75_02260 [Candidatus Thermoplasmatota archaeon]|nr:hypothetical protein [Candidatus Thermoplasmatota archaeon]
MNNENINYLVNMTHLIAATLATLAYRLQAPPKTTTTSFFFLARHAILFKH